MNAKLTTLTLTEQEIRTLLLGLHGYLYDTSKEVQQLEANGGPRQEFLRQEYAETQTLIRKLREA